MMAYLAADTQVVLVLSYMNPGAVFRASLVVFKTRYHLFVFLTRAEGAEGNRNILFAHPDESADAND
jgi:hypothetical protein